MKNMWGTTSEAYDPRAGTLVCSADDVSYSIEVRVAEILTLW